MPTSDPWVFGSSQLLQALSIIATFSAVLVSLWLANRKRRVKFDVRINKECSGLSIVNKGDTKFLVRGFGIKIGRDYYFQKNSTFFRIRYAQEDRAQDEPGHKKYEIDEKCYLLCALEPGDFANVGFCGDLPREIKPGEKCSFFIIADFKIKKCRIDSNKPVASKFRSGIEEMVKINKKYISRMDW
jgi:hypothetical protein